MKLNIDTKFEGEPTCRCKKDIRDLANFHANTGKSQNLHFDGLLMSKVYKERDKKLQRSYVS